MTRRTARCRSLLWRWLLGVGIAAPLAANVHTAWAVAVWPAVALVGPCELLMMVIRGAQVPADVTAWAGLSVARLTPHPLQVQPHRCRR